MTTRIPTTLDETLTRRALRLALDGSTDPAASPAALLPRREDHRPGGVDDPAAHNLRHGRHAHMIIGRNEIGVQNMIRVLSEALGMDLPG